MRLVLEFLRALIKLSLIGGILFLGSCSAARTLLKQAPTDTPRGWRAPLAVTLPDAEAKRRLETYIYGRMDAVPSVKVVSIDILSEAALDGRATLKQWDLELTYGETIRHLDLVTLLPNDLESAPLILSQNFCPNHNVIPLDGVKAPDNVSFDCSGGGLFWTIAGSFFGRYITTPPLEMILDQGYGFAAMYPGQVVPDSGQRGVEQLDALFPNETNRPGALALWSRLLGVTANIIEAEEGARSIIVYGHSRYAKTALLAGAWSDEIDGVLAHQSGTLGASALDDANGEPLNALVENYPHWPGLGISPYADNPASLPVRASNLLALLGEKPVLLGNARRDVWSDPWGAFTEAKAAWADDFRSESPSDFRPTDKKAYWLRPGTHGVVKEDWPAFLEFLNAHFKPETT